MSILIGPQRQGGDHLPIFFYEINCDKYFYKGTIVEFRVNILLKLGSKRD